MTLRPAKTNVKLILLLAVLSIAAVVGVAFLFLSWVSTPLGLTVDQIDPAELAELRVQLLNRRDGKDDIGPVKMLPEDFPALLAPLRNAVPEADKPGMPWLGEYQIRFRDDRRLTIRLRWERRPPFDSRPAFAAAAGTGLGGAAAWLPPVDESVVWMVIEGRIYRAGRLLDLLRVAEECAARAKP
jgi:hypothetical protein